MSDQENIFAAMAKRLGREPVGDPSPQEPLLAEKRKYVKSDFLEAKRIEADRARWDEYERKKAERERRFKGRTSENHAERMREYFRELRLAMLDAVCPTRHCMSCGELKVETRRLTIFMTTELAGLPGHEELLAKAVQGHVAVCIGCKRIKYPFARSINR